MAAQTAAGLEGVVLTSTRLSKIDGTAGQLSYVGYNIHALAEQTSFEEVCFLLWNGELPTAAQLSEFRAGIIAEQALSQAELALLASVPTEGHGMDALRTLASAIAQLDPRAEELSDANAVRIGTKLLGKLSALITAWDRRRRGLAPIESDPQLGYAANMLLMLHGRRPGPSAEKALNTYLVLLAEHGLNASTFAARVAISAQSDVYSAMVAAIATLKGLLHGGANQKAMEAFLEIGTPENAATYIDALLKRRGRLMGIGHRIYRVEDPRVRHLRARVEALAQEQGGTSHLVTEEVGRVVARHPYFAERQLNPNVEFYSAPLLYELGLPLDLFTVAFALSRTAGWIAHIREQLAENRIIRPKADYSGPPPREFVAIEGRK
jgi:citrate synthase